MAKKNKKTNCTVVGTSLSSTLTVGMLAIGPGVSQALFSPGHQHRSTKVRSKDFSNPVPGPTVGGLGGAQILASSNPHVYVLTKCTGAKARPVSAEGALFSLDVLQALSLQSQQWWCKSEVPTAVRRDFNFSSLVAQPLGLCCGFIPTSTCGPPPASAPKAALEHTRSSNQPSSTPADTRLRLGCTRLWHGPSI